MFAKQDNIDVGDFKGSFEGFFYCPSYRKGKVESWLRLVVMTHLSTSRKYLLYFLQDIKVLTFSVAHCNMSVFISRIFGILGREKLYWFHGKYHYTYPWSFRWLC